MKRTVEQTPDGLDGEVAEYGENLSQGQRQLLCLGRSQNQHYLLLNQRVRSGTALKEPDQDIVTAFGPVKGFHHILPLHHQVHPVFVLQYVSY